MKETIFNGLHFNANTPNKVMEILTANKHTGRRLRIWYGDQLTGKSWNEENDIMGAIGSSTGPNRIPILLARSNSMGGGAILTHCIIRIDDIKTRRTLFTHSNFHTGLSVDCKTVVNSEGQEVANFLTEKACFDYIDFMEGRSYSKAFGRVSKRDFLNQLETIEKGYQVKAFPIVQFHLSSQWKGHKEYQLALKVKREATYKIFATGSLTHVRNFLDANIERIKNAILAEYGRDSMQYLLAIDTLK